MHLEYAFIADAADARDGLFYVLRGGTDIWNIQADTPLPWVVGPMSFVVRLVGETREIGLLKQVGFKIVDADSRPIGLEGSAQIEFGPHPVDRTRTSGALIHFRVPTASVPGPGAYFFEVHSDDQRLCQVPFWVMSVDATSLG